MNPAASGGYPQGHLTATPPPTTAFGRDRVTGWLGSAALVSGLLAGTYFGFACAVMPGLERSDDATYVEAMRNINVVIENPVFFGAFFGSVILPGIAWQRLRRTGGPDTRRWNTIGFWFGVAGLLITMIINVPLNDRLARNGASTRAVDITAAREHFDAPWVIANITRTLTSIAAAAALVRALVLHGRRR